MRTFTYLFSLIASMSGGLAHAQENTTLTVNTSDEFGPYLVTGNGRPVYLFDTTIGAGDGLAPLVSCAERCREDWPLVTVAGDLVLGDALDADLGATVTSEGQRIAIYNSNTLFYFHRDTEESGPIGHGLTSHGGGWFLITPDGDAVPAG